MQSLEDGLKAMFTSFIKWGKNQIKYYAECYQELMLNTYEE